MDICSDDYKIFIGDAWETLDHLPDQHFQTVVTSPPYYGLRRYGVGAENGEIGLETSPREYVEKLVKICAKIKRVLRDDGIFWLNLGDSYVRRGGSHENRKSYTGFAYARKQHSMNKIPSDMNVKPKDVLGIPWMVAFALRDDGWYLRQEIIWSKNNPIPESVTDRCTKSHEYIFMLTKQQKYFFNHQAAQEKAVYAGKKRGGSDKRFFPNNNNMDNKIYNTRNMRSVWNISVSTRNTIHVAAYPIKLAERCILLGSKEGDWVLDPFAGSGTTIKAALLNKRKAIGIEINQIYAIEAAIKAHEYQQNKPEIIATPNTARI